MSVVWCCPFTAVIEISRGYRPISATVFFWFIVLYRLVFVIYLIDISIYQRLHCQLRQDVAVGVAVAVVMSRRLLSKHERIVSCLGSITGR